MKRFNAVAVLLSLMVFWSACQDESISTSGMADDHFHLYSDGQYMPVSVRGNLDAGKMLVIVHGGPGGSSMVYRDEVLEEVVESQCAVVYWDQRFAGNTQGSYGGSDLEDFSKDMWKLLQLIKYKYGEDKEVHLMGHSWGGLLVPLFLETVEHQALVTSWIQVGGAHDYRLNDSLTREMLLNYGQQEYEAGRNEEDWEEIIDWCKNNGFEGAENAGQLNQFAHQAEGLIEDIQSEGGDVLPAFRTNRIALMAQLVNGWVSGLRELDGPAYDLDSEAMLQSIQTPVLMLWGKYDFVCPPELMDHLKQHVGSTQVEERLFEFSGHSPMVNEPEAFWKAVMEWMK